MGPTVLLVTVAMFSINSQYINGFTNEEDTCQQLGCQECMSYKLRCVDSSMMYFPTLARGRYTIAEISKQQLLDSGLSSKLFTNYQDLEEFRFTYVRFISSFTFSNLKHLRELHVNNNKLGYIQNYAFFDLELNNLILDNNENLRLEKDAFNGLTVRILSICGCNLKQLNFATFSPLFKKLTVLSLSNNSIAKINDHFETSFSRINQLQILALNGNPLTCTCDNLWLIKILKFRHVNQPAHPALENFETLYPRCENRKNLSLLYVNHSSLLCDAASVVKVQVSMLTSDCRVLILVCEASKLTFIKWQLIYRNGTVESLSNETMHPQISNSFYFSRRNPQHGETIRCLVGRKAYADVNLYQCKESGSILVTTQKPYVLIAGLNIILVSCLGVIGLMVYWKCKQGKLNHKASSNRNIATANYVPSRALDPLNSIEQSETIPREFQMSQNSTSILQPRTLPYLQLPPPPTSPQPQVPFYDYVHLSSSLC